MLKERDPHVQKALDMGVTVFAGEAEGRLGQVLKDAFYDKLQPVYNFMDDLPNIEGVATPLLPAERVHLTAGATTSFDAGRGCPFACSFCTIINVQGRKSRRRSPEDIERIVRANVAQGLHSFFITDDNFARNKDWEIDPRPTDRSSRSRKTEDQFHHPGRHALSQAAEFHRKMQTRRRQTRFHRAREHQSRQPARREKTAEQDHRLPADAARVEAGRASSRIADTFSGFPGDTRESIMHDIEIIKRELPVDLLEFFYLTPLPGSEDHKKLHESRHRDGRRSEQIRSQSRRHRAPENVARTNGETTYRDGVGNVLHRRARRDRSAPRDRDGNEPGQDDVLYHLVQGLYRHRRNSSARRRIFAAKGAD